MEMAVVAVPETAVREEHRPEARKYYIGLARQGAVMQPETEPEGMQASSEHQFGLGVCPANPRHHLAADFGSNDVRHKLSLVSFRGAMIDAIRTLQ